MSQIADFGMARDLEDEDYYVSHGGQVPVKWTAPEVCPYSIIYMHNVMYAEVCPYSIIYMHNVMYAEVCPYSIIYMHNVMYAQ